MVNRNKPFNITAAQLDGAYQWLCKKRVNYPPRADIWTFRYHWPETKHKILDEVNRGDYRFSPLQQIKKRDGQIIHLWSSADSLVIKCLAFQLTDRLSLSPNCTHPKNHGGLKATVRNVQRHLKHYRYVLKTDVQDFYTSIDQTMLLEQLANEISSRILLNYLWQVIRRTVEAGGNFWDITSGISRGCSISPILGALYLKPLDERLTQNKWVYVRYMDDILILSKTRWHNRQAIKALNQVFEQLKLAKHPDKTFIGRIDRGFDFLGYHFSLGPLQLAQQTIKKHAQHIIQLYEQQKTKKATSEEMAFVLGTYVKRWAEFVSARVS